MNKFRAEIEHDDCPVCGHPRGATMSSTVWGHWVSCCSDECGEKMRVKLENLREDKKMIALQKKLERVKAEIYDMVKKEAKNVGGVELARWY
jgi:hypothetical protein